MANAGHVSRRHSDSNTSFSPASAAKDCISGIAVCSTGRAKGKTVAARSAYFIVVVPNRVDNSPCFAFGSTVSQTAIKRQRVVANGNGSGVRYVNQNELPAR